MRIFYNNWDNTARMTIRVGVDPKTAQTKPVEIFGRLDYEEVVPQEWWDDFLVLYANGGQPTDLLLAKAIMGGKVISKKRHNMVLVVNYNGPLMGNLLAKDQQGMFYNRPKTREEKIFREWVLYFLKNKFVNI